MKWDIKFYVFKVAVNLISLIIVLLSCSYHCLLSSFFFYRLLQLLVPSPGSCNGSYLSWHLSQSLLKQKTCHIHRQIDLVPLFGRRYLNQRRKKRLWIYLCKLHVHSNIPVPRNDVISFSRMINVSPGAYKFFSDTCFSDWSFSSPVCISFLSYFSTKLFSVYWEGNWLIFAFILHLR